MHSKAQVWQAAKDCGLDEFITAVSKAFPGAIDGVAISAKGVACWRQMNGCFAVSLGLSQGHAHKTAGQRDKGENWCYYAVQRG